MWRKADAAPLTAAGDIRALRGMQEMCKYVTKQSDYS
jgi:hypothetical protein